MIYQRTKPTKPPSQTKPTTTKHINVTDLTPNQRRKLFIDCMNQNGFTSFTKNDENKQTYYTFHYETIPDNLSGCQHS